VLSGSGAETGQAGQEQVVAGRYRLLERVGSGGMGTVWLAEDPLLGRQVALKKMHAPLEGCGHTEATSHERTRREARSVARIRHPNVVVVYDVVDHEGLPCIVMEYVPSRTLSDVLKQDGPLTADEAVRIGQGMIGALRAAHAAGVLHRDVKPANVLLGTDGRVVLTDFGIAMATDTSTLTRTGEIIGSVDYLAPERLRGEPPAAAADLWALGATLYTAVEGRSPFHRDTAVATAYAVSADPPHPPSRDTALSALIMHLLEKDPADRPSGEDVDEWLRAQAASPDRPFDAQPEPRQTRQTREFDAPPADTHPAPQPRTGGRRGVRAAVAVLVAAAVAVTAFVALRPGGGKGSHDGKPGSGGGTSASALPQGYHYEKEKDYGLSVPLPDGWTRTDTPDSDIAYTRQATQAGLRISVSDLASSDQLQHFKDDEEQSVSQGKLPQYKKLRMQRTTYRKMPAAVWEFTFQGRAREFRAISLGFGAPGGKEYSLYLSAPSADWNRHRKIFEQVREHLRIKGAK
jgi:eukaryotic-like serine/threonine-protein kinase